jgi:alpha-mannosidase
MSFAADGSGAIVLSVLKSAEDGGGALILRAYESTGRPARATIALPLVDRTFEAELGPWEIATFRVPRQSAEPVVETNLLEWS